MEDLSRDKPCAILCQLQNKWKSHWKRKKFSLKSLPLFEEVAIAGRGCIWEHSPSETKQEFTVWCSELCQFNVASSARQKICLALVTIE